MFHVEHRNDCVKFKFALEIGNVLSILISMQILFLIDFNIFDYYVSC